jgi:subtilisin family serine protease
LQKSDREITPQRSDQVSFEVLCRPRSGAGVVEMAAELAGETADRYSPDEPTVHDVARNLMELGFRVFLDETGTSVSAQGPHELFERRFQTALRKRERVYKTRERQQTVQFFDTKQDAPEPNVANVPGAMYVTINRPPLHFASPLPPPVGYYHLRVPGDVAMLTGASAAHRRNTPAGDRATGAGVRVAMLDTGFENHPYFQAHGYRLNPVAAADTSGAPDDDTNGHGTGEVANIFACAPDATVFGVKMGLNAVLSFDRAVALNADVISCSWGYHLPGVTRLPIPLIPLYLRILTVVARGTTVVFSAGNGHVGFPGMMRDVVSAGGVFVDNNGALRASNYASSFVSSIFAGRRVPDFCGLVGMRPRAVYIMLPIPDACDIDQDLGGTAFPNGDATARNDGWGAFSGTSAAAPQIAGVCALLLQKRAGLTPAQVKAILRATATDVVAGQSAMGDAAGPGPDLATGTGLVNALRAWQGA